MVAPFGSAINLSEHKEEEEEEGLGILGDVAVLMEVSPELVHISGSCKPVYGAHDVDNKVVACNRSAGARYCWISENVPISLMQLSRRGPVKGSGFISSDISLTLEQMRQSCGGCDEESYGERGQASFSCLWSRLALAIVEILTCI